MKIYGRTFNGYDNTHKLDFDKTPTQADGNESTKLDRTLNSYDNTRKLDVDETPTQADRNDSTKLDRPRGE